MAGAARFEVVATSVPTERMVPDGDGSWVPATVTRWHARFVASNGETVWVTESYEQRESSVHAIEVLTGDLAQPALEVREVDERVPS